MRVENKTYWQECITCFSSVPYETSNFTEPEVWFTPQHTHDKEALGERTTMFDLMHTAISHSNDDHECMNRLVNIDSVVANERGISYILVNTTGYTGTTEMKIQIT